MGGALTLGGFLGGNAVGHLSDSVFGGARAPAVLCCAALQAVALCALARPGWWPLYAVDDGAGLVALAAAGILGGYTLLSYTVPQDLPPAVVATACGVMTAAGYVSSGLAGACPPPALQARDEA